MDAYLDIETTGLSPYDDEITVIGIGLAEGRNLRIVQLFDEELTRGNLAAALAGASRLYTYNGSRFDLPFIHEAVGIDLNERVQHYDLMFDCWNRSLYGGFKVVEEKLGIPRRLKGLSGKDAVYLWYDYKNGDQKALDVLLEYNREDVTNLRHLRRKLRLP
ncbi:MAG: ribonuclease H-like domain-containing protein [Dehalococcoidia bacterium]